MILDNTRPRRALTRRALLLALTPGAAALVTLAVLRPAVRAQAAPASVAAAPAPVLMPVAPAAPPVKPTDRAWPAKAPAPPPLLKPVRVAPPRAAPFVAQVAPAAPARPNGPAVSRVTTHAPAAGGRAPLLFTASRVTAGASRGAVKPQSPAFSFSSDLALNGTTLLAGVTDADKPGGPWWSASGASLPIPVYDTAKYRAESHVFGGSTRNVILAFRLPGATDGATLAFKTPGALGSSSEGSWLFKMQGREHLTEAQAHLRSGGARVLTVAFPASLTKTDVQIGVASGPWKVAASCGLGEFDRAGGASVKDGGSTFVFSPMSETKGGTVVSIATDATDDLRVVAVGADGRESLPDQPGDNSMGALDQITVRFALPLAQIKEVRVETRTFRWVEIKDIALQPTK